MKEHSPDPAHGHRPLPPTTTEQEDLMRAGQRRVNLIWEWTQAVLAVQIIIANMVVGIVQGLGYAGNREYPVILSSALFLVIGFYFGRTNHSAVGGIGKKPAGEYTGR